MNLTHAANRAGRRLAFRFYRIKNKTRRRDKEATREQHIQLVDAQQEAGMESRSYRKYARL